MISTLLIKYKWIIAFITSLIILKIISWVRNKINSDIEKRFSSPEEKAKVSVDLFGRYVQVRPAQFVFDSPERFYPYLFNKFNRYVIAHQFKKSNREIRFVFEAFPNLIHLKEKDIEPMKIKFGVSGERKIVEMDLNDNFSNLRLIGTMGIGKSNIAKILTQQVSNAFNVVIVSTKISDFSDFKNQGIELLNPNKDSDLERLLNLTNELKTKIVNEENCRTWIILDEAIKDLMVHGYEVKKPREKIKETIVENINYFLSLGRKFKLFLLINTQDENIKNEAKLDLGKIGNVISGRITNQASADLYGIPIGIAQRRDLTNGKLIFATQSNRECFVFKSYLYKPKGTQK
nr:hypothetical protein HAGR004_01290 [Bdellovibrio sp. HAGR004]